MTWKYKPIKTHYPVTFLLSFFVSLSPNSLSLYLSIYLDLSLYLDLDDLSSHYPNIPNFAANDY